MIRRVLRSVLNRVAPRVPGARPARRTPPTTRDSWKTDTAGPSTPGPAAEPEPEPPEVEVEVEAETVAGWVADGRDVLLVDIREPHEVRQGFAQGALLLPMNEVPHTLAALPRDRVLVVYCAAGVRSHGVSHWLREQGYEETWSLVGGLGAWLSTGAAWRQPDRGAAFQPLEAVRVSDDGGDALPPTGTGGRVQAVHDGGVDVLFTLADGTITRIDDLDPGALAPIVRRRR
jgi:rhodanese-related sulfurtransferase